MIGLIIVSHSKQLAEGLLQLANQMQNTQHCQIRIAAGIDDDKHPIGTDAIKVMEAIESLADASHIILLMDLGSAILSAETALDLIDSELAKKVHLCSAPLVEGTIAMTAAASGGAPIDTILLEAKNALQAKQQQLNEDINLTPSMPNQLAPTSKYAIKTQCIIQNPAGLHLRPAAKISSTLGAFKANIQLRHGNKIADAKSMNQITLLQAYQGDKIELIAEGEDAQAAIDAFNLLADENFGDDINTIGNSNLVGEVVFLPNVSGLAYHLPTCIEHDNKSPQDNATEIQRMTQALNQVCTYLDTLADETAKIRNNNIADIFHGHSLLLSDEALLEDLTQHIKRNSTHAESAILSVFNEMAAQYKQLSSPYLKARFIDIEDLKNQLLKTLAQHTATKYAFAEPTILISQDLGPIELMQHIQPILRGIVLAQGSPYSHTAIIATKMGIPMLVNLGEKVNKIPPKSKLILSLEKSTLSIDK